MSGIILAALLLVQPPEAAAVVEGAARAAERGTLAAWLRPWSARPARDRMAQLARGVASWHLYRLADAERQLRSALGTNDGIDRQARLAVARLVAHRGDYRAADSLLVALQLNARAAGDTSTLIETLLLRAGIGRRVRTAAAADAVLDTAATLGVQRVPRLAASWHCRRAGNAAIAGDEAAMRREAQLGLAAARVAGSVRLQAACHFVRATSFARQGRSDSMSRAMDTTIALQRRSGDLIALAAARQWQGFYALSLGHPGRAEQYLREAWTAGTASGSADALAWTALSRASVGASLGDTRSAQHWLLVSDSLMRRTGDVEGQRTVLRMRAVAAFAAGDTARSWPLVAEVLRQAAAAGDVNAGRDGLFTLARHALITGDRRRSSEALTSLATLIRDRGMRGFESSVRTMRGEYLLQQGQWTEARTEFEWVLANIHETQHAFRHSVETLRAIALARAGRLADAAAAALVAESAHRQWRSSIADSALRRFTTVVDRGGIPYFTELVRLLAEGNRLGDALRLAESQRSLRLREQMLDAAAWATADSRATPEAPPVDLAEVQRGLPDDATAVLSFVAGGHGIGSVGLVVTRGDAWSFPVPSLDALRGDVQRLVATAEQGRPTSPSARALGRVLLEPARARLTAAGIRQLVIVADGVLHLVPFALLEVDGQPAVRHWALSHAPSVALALAQWRTTPEPARGPVVALGDPVALDDRGEALPRLPGARDELRMLQRQVGGGVIRTGAAARESYLTRLGAPPRLLHVAAHGRVDDWDGRQAALLLTPGDGADGTWLAGEIATGDFTNALVVLSACRTSLGELVAGEGVTGLTSAFLQAGARAVVTTAWRIPDQQVVPVVEGFYAGLAQGLGAAEALQRAQVEAHRRGVPPAAWAAFRLVGDPRLTLSLR